jgi:hypothetical protein
MSKIFAFSADTYANAAQMLASSAPGNLWQCRQQAPGIGVNNGPNGSGNAFIPGLGANSFYFQGSSPVSGITYLHQNFNSSNNTQNIVYFSDSTFGEQCHVVLETSVGTVRLYRGATLLATSAVNVVPINAYFSAVIRMAIGASATVDVFIDGISVGGQFPFTGNTQQSSNASWDQLGYTTIGNAYVSDIACYTTNLGPIRVRALVPTANGGTITWAPLSGSNYQMVDGGIQTANYNSSSTVGQIDDYVMQTISGTIYGVSMMSYAWASDSGARSYSNYVLSGSSTTLGSTRSLGTGALLYRDDIDNDPATGVPWASAAALNAARPGYKLVA